MSLGSLAYYYCTQTNVENWLSIQGVRCRLDDDGDGQPNTFELVRMVDCVINATMTVDYHIGTKYSQAALSTSNFINRLATILAGYDLCTCRGNPVPESVLEAAEKAEEKLDKIAQGKRYVPDAALRRNCAPAYDNIRCDARFRYRVIRVERRTSSQQPTNRPQAIDYPEAYSFEI